MMSAFIVVKLRGTVNQNRTVKTTLEHLHLGSRFRATIIPDNQISKGMLQTVKNHVAWIDADSSTIESIITSRGEKSNSVKYNSELAQKDGYPTIAELAKALSENKINLSSLSNLKPSFRLSPPKGGFRKSTRRMYSQGGTLGYNPDLSKLISNMV